VYLLNRRLGMDETSLWNYRAETVRVVDGDTAIFRFDLGFNVFAVQTCRFDGINAPEHNTVEGQVAITFLKALLPVGTPVLIKTRKNKKEKYGRLLATVVLENGQVVNEMLIIAGHAVPWDGKGIRPVL
jgi:endonuclease YncB( thermonuclease family)